MNLLNINYPKFYFYFFIFFILYANSQHGKVFGCQGVAKVVGGGC